MPAEQPGARRMILVIEDDDTTREALTMLLEGAGFAVAGAANGQEALQTLRRGPPPDLILLDLAMPVMDGWQFRKEQQRDPALASIPVIVLSGTGDLKQLATSLQAVSLLQKPVEFDQLLATVRGLTSQVKPGVLVVDDEPQILTLLGLALRHHGFSVWLAANGKEAIELYRQQKAAISVVLMDVQMPGLDGPWTLAALQQIDPEVRCCFMSGHTGNYTSEMLLALGAAGIIQKPFGLAEISQDLRQIVAAPRTSPERE